MGGQLPVKASVFSSVVWGSYSYLVWIERDAPCKARSVVPAGCTALSKMVAFGQMMVGHSKGPGVDPVATVRRLSGLGAGGGRTSGSGKDRLGLRSRVACIW